MYEAYSSCLLFPWQAPTQKTKATTMTIAIAIRPTRRASGTSPVGARSGSGSVWLARDEQTGLEVALKIIAREGKAAVRAEREAAAASRLRHPSCLRAYAFDHDSSNVYIAYEFVPGKTFREALRAGELV